MRRAWTFLTPHYTVTTQRCYNDPRRSQLVSKQDLARQPYTCITRITCSRTVTPTDKSLSRPFTRDLADIQKKRMCPTLLSAEEYNARARPKDGISISLRRLSTIQSSATRLIVLVLRQKRLSNYFHYWNKPVNVLLLTKASPHAVMCNVAITCNFTSSEISPDNAATKRWEHVSNVASQFLHFSSVQYVIANVSRNAMSDCLSTKQRRRSYFLNSYTLLCRPVSLYTFI